MRSPSKRKRLEGEVLVLLESATDGMEGKDLIEIDCASWSPALVSAGVRFLFCYRWWCHLCLHCSFGWIDR